MRIFPDTITIASALVALLAITATTVTAMAWAIVVCAVLDLSDGRLARWLGTESRFGRELDSMADLLAFGAAPAVLLHRLDVPTWAILAYLGTVLWRIARHNVQPTASICGVPSNAFGVLVAVGALAGWDATQDFYYLTVPVACVLMVMPFTIIWRST